MSLFAAQSENTETKFDLDFNSASPDLGFNSASP